jgi:chromate reductase
MSSLHIAGISGSLRKGSLNTALLTTVQSLLPPDVTFERIEIGTLPLFNSDLEADGPVLCSLISGNGSRAPMRW